MILNILVSLLLIYLSYTDLITKKVPNKIIVPAILIAITIRFLEYGASGVRYLLTGVGLYLFFLLISLISNRIIGGGDIKVFALVGICFGSPHIFYMFAVLSFVCLIVMIIVLLKHKHLDLQLPFVPIIATSTIVSLVLIEVVGYDYIVRTVLINT